MSDVSTRVLFPNGEASPEDEVEAYAQAVRRALADLPEDVREELSEDLLENLRDTAAESDVALVERLGPPEAYAEELRDAAGLRPMRSDRFARRRRRRALLRSRADRVRERAAREPVRGWLTDLRTAWWVLRGALVVVFALLIAGGTLSDQLLLALPAIAVAVVVSVRLGRRRVRRGWPRIAVIVANTAIVLVALGVLSDVGAAYGGYSPDYESQVTELTNEDGKAIENVFAYDTEGRLLQNVFLYDQDGHPVNLPDYGTLAFPSDAFGREVRNLVPVPALPMDANGIHPEQAAQAEVVPPGTVVVPVMPTPSPTPSPSPSPTSAAEGSGATPESPDPGTGEGGTATP